MTLLFMTLNLSIISIYRADYIYRTSLKFVGKCLNEKLENIVDVQRHVKNSHVNT